MARILFLISISFFIVNAEDKPTDSISVADSSIVEIELVRSVSFKLIADSTSNNSSSLSYVTNSLYNYSYFFYKIYEESALSDSNFVLEYDPSVPANDAISMKISEYIGKLDFSGVSKIDFLFSVDRVYEDSINSMDKEINYIKFSSSNFLKIVEEQSGTYEGDVKNLTSITNPIVSLKVDSVYSNQNNYVVIDSLYKKGYKGRLWVDSQDSIVTLYSESIIDSFTIKTTTNCSYGFAVSEKSVSLLSNDSTKLSCDILGDSSALDNMLKVAAALEYIATPEKEISVKLSFYDGTVMAVNLSTDEKREEYEKEELIKSFRKMLLKRSYGKYDVVLQFHNEIVDSSALNEKHLFKSYLQPTTTPIVNYPQKKLESVYSRYITENENFIGGYKLRLFVGKESRLDSINVIADNIHIESFQKLITNILLSETRLEKYEKTIVDIELDFTKSQPIELIEYNSEVVTRNRFLDTLALDSLTYLTRTEIVNGVNDSARRVDDFLRGRAKFIKIDTISLLFQLEIDNRGNVKTVKTDTSEVLKDNISVYNSIFADMSRWKFKKTQGNMNYKIKFEYNFIVDDTLKTKGRKKEETYYYTTKKSEDTRRIPRFFLFGGIAFNALDSLKANLYNHTKISSGLVQQRDELSSFSMSGYSYYFTAGFNYPKYFLGNFIFGVYTDFQYQTNSEVTNLIFNGSEEEITNSFNQSSYWGGVSLTVYYSIMKNFIALSDRDDFLIKFSMGRTLYNQFYLDELREDNTYFRYTGDSDNQFYSHIGFVFNKRIGNKSTGVELGYKFLKFNSVKHQDIDSNIKYSEIDKNLSDGDLELDFSGLVFRLYFGI